jgi:hypothetical protein
MTLAELVTVMAIGSIILGMLLTVTFSVAKHNAKSLARQERADGTRQVSLWLTDALANAAPNPAEKNGSVFELARDRKMVFLSALPTTDPNHGPVSRVTVVIGQQCWSGDEDPGVLRRCVQRSQKGNDGSAAFCAKDASGCPDDLFEDFVVARNIKGGPAFSYSLETDAGTASADVAEVTNAAQLTRIVAVEFNVTVGGEPGSANEDVQATVIKRHAVKGWSRL